MFGYEIYGDIARLEAEALDRDPERTSGTPWRGRGCRPSERYDLDVYIIPPKHPILWDVSLWTIHFGVPPFLERKWGLTQEEWICYLMLSESHKILQNYSVGWLGDSPISKAAILMLEWPLSIPAIWSSNPQCFSEDLENHAKSGRPNLWIWKIWEDSRFHVVQAIFNSVFPRR